MPAAAQAPTWEEIDPFIESFEKSLSQSGHSELSDHLPEASHRLFLPVLCELVRVDLEFRWDHGQPKYVEQYLAEFPALSDDSVSLREIAFEEYRMRARAGESPVHAEYHERFGIDTSGWSVFASGHDESDVRAFPENSQLRNRSLSQTGPKEGARPIDSVEPLAAAYLELRSSGTHSTSLEVQAALESLEDPKGLGKLLAELHRCDPQIAARLAHALSTLPRAGSHFLGFHLIHELGRGAFGRVYLAQQGELANRPVALKITTDWFGESYTLAQLQHTNIVPIYSVHRAPPFEAICMPYFGATTLSRILASLGELPSLPDSLSRWPMNAGK
jgi:hypothetical protein